MSLKNSENSSACIGLINPKSPSNVGSVLRAAGCFDAQAIYYTGERYARAAKYQTDTKNVANKISVEACHNIFEKCPPGTQKVAIELVEGASPLHTFTHPDHAFYVFGPEDGSIDQETLDQCDYVVYIPTIGCLNLAATANVVLYDRLAKSGKDFDHDNLIKQSRDTNNSLKVRD